MECDKKKLEICQIYSQNQPEEKQQTLTLVAQPLNLHFDFDMLLSWIFLFIYFLYSLFWKTFIYLVYTQKIKIKLQTYMGATYYKWT